MGSATCRHSYPTCGRPSYPALIPDPLEQEKLFANPEWIIMCFELAYIEKILIINFQFMPTDMYRAEFRVQWDKESVMSEESALCDVLLWPSLTVTLDRLELRSFELWNQDDMIELRVQSGEKKKQTNKFGGGGGCRRRERDIVEESGGSRGGEGNEGRGQEHK